ncbi:MAG: hypothetical protein ABIQ15_13130 [Nocardioides sp.]
MTTPTGEATEIALLIDDLVHRLPDASPDLVHQVVVDAFQEFADARVRTFVPLLVARVATDRVRLRTVTAKGAGSHPISA